MSAAGARRGTSRRPPDKPIAPLVPGSTANLQTIQRQEQAGQKTRGGNAGELRFGPYWCHNWCQAVVSVVGGGAKRAVSHEITVCYVRSGVEIPQPDTRLWRARVPRGKRSCRSRDVEQREAVWPMTRRR